MCIFLRDVYKNQIIHQVGKQANAAATADIREPYYVPDPGEPSANVMSSRLHNNLLRLVAQPVFS